jgi:hypothetical protein
VLAGSPVGGKTKTFIASADYGDTKYVFVELNSGRNQCNICNAATDTPIGVMENNPESGSAMVVQLDGTTKIIASAAIAKGSWVGTTAAGKAVVKNTLGDVCVGIALEAATASGDIIEILLFGPAIRYY